MPLLVKLLQTDEGKPEAECHNGQRQICILHLSSREKLSYTKRIFKKWYMPDQKSLVKWFKISLEHTLYYNYADTVKLKK
jgi:hypothetical protein